MYDFMILETDFFLVSLCALLPPRPNAARLCLKIAPFFSQYLGRFVDEYDQDTLYTCRKLSKNKY